MAPSGQSTTIAHQSPTWEEQLSLLCGTTFCVPHPDRDQKAQQKQRCSSSKPVNTVQVGFERVKAVPAIYLAMTGVCKECQGHRIGTRLIMDALNRALLIA